MSFSIVFDRLLKESLAEYGAILDSIVSSPDQENLTKFTSYSAELETLEESEEEVPAELATQILKDLASSLTTLNKAALDRDFESNYILLLHIFQLINNNDSNIATILDQYSEIIESLATFDLSNSSIKSTTIVAVLSNFYNILPTSENYKVTLISSILKFIKSNLSSKNNTDPLSSILITLSKALKEILAESAATEEQSLKLSLTLTELLFVSSNSNEAIASLKSIITTYKPSSTTTPEIVQLIVDALNTEKYFDLSFLSAIELPEDLTSLLTTYINIELFEFTQLPSSIFTTYEAINKETLAFKLKLTTITKLNDLSSNTITFDSIKTSLSLEDDNEIEYYLIQAIKHGYLQGRISQEKRVFYVNKILLLSAYNKISIDEWKLIKTNLQSWKDSLTDLRNSVDQASKANKKKFYHRNRDYNRTQIQSQQPASQGQPAVAEQETAAPAPTETATATEEIVA